MIDGLIGINIMVNKVLWKESLNSDGHQFHQYQQNEQSPLNSDGHQFHQYQQNEQSPLTKHNKIPWLIWMATWVPYDSHF